VSRRGYRACGCQARSRYRRRVSCSGVKRTVLNTEAYGVRRDVGARVSGRECQARGGEGAVSGTWVSSRREVSGTRRYWAWRCWGADVEARVSGARRCRGADVRGGGGGAVSGAGVRGVGVKHEAVSGAGGWYEVVVGGADVRYEADAVVSGGRRCQARDGGGARMSNAVVLVVRCQGAVLNTETHGVRRAVSDARRGCQVRGGRGVEARVSGAWVSGACRC
jgi:hypothetical protein